ncbi:hypothetical protein QBC40DRAFT_176967 [Triangularia verruculosa]|uniref:Molybdate transporter 1 n=1 Tax=Triangularia verruculosa TaxID=2587418 RepID=A0AAN7AUL1_9PEZI|nr:hypothetical protein QBC40DRAFT_176967 [Triangularia verruculosa]
MSPFQSLVAINRRNLAVFRHAPLSEISGALGDLGSFLPLTLALALRGAISLPATLITSGLFNMATGAVFGVPLPVQPMKAIAAATLVAPESASPRPQAAGLLVSLVLLFLSLTGLLRTLSQHTPSSLVKGIQLGTGLSLINSSSSLLLLSPSISLVAFLPLLLTISHPRFPYALLVFVAGIAFTLPNHIPSLAPWMPVVEVPKFWPLELPLSMAVAQLPLTVLNSVIAVEALTGELIPGVGGVRATGLGVSVATMNLIGAWVGAMPVCHGAGGLAAQWRFGARSGASVMALGVVKVAAGWLWGEGLERLLKTFPEGVLGVMLAAAGVELAGKGLDLSRGEDQGEDGLNAEERLVITLMTAAGMVATKNAAIGFLIGGLCYGCYRLKNRGEESGERTGLLR